jgi:hypothetical protein
MTCKNKIFKKKPLLYTRMITFVYPCLHVIEKKNQKKHNFFLCIFKKKIPLQNVL